MISDLSLNASFRSKYQFENIWFLKKIKFFYAKWAWPGRGQDNRYKFFHIAYYTHRSIIFKIWGWKLLYLKICGRRIEHQFVHLFNISREKTCSFVARYLATQSSDQFFECTMWKNGRFPTLLVATNRPNCRNKAVKTLP